MAIVIVSLHCGHFLLAGYSANLFTIQFGSSEHLDKPLSNIPFYKRVTVVLKISIATKINEGESTEAMSVSGFGHSAWGK